MIVVTGAAGFIGSCFVRKLNDERFRDIVLVDDFSNPTKENNYKDKIFTAKVHRNDFINWIDENARFIQIIIHLGARTDTTEFNKSVFDELNFGYSQKVWQKCVEHGLPLIYASSAATYGMGEHGFSDNHLTITSLKPLNPYGESKNEFDKWALAQSEKPYFWAGLKFFNVYGPNEYHKGRMASVAFHAYKQIKQAGKLKLFRSHNPDYKNGEQLRDFVSVFDVSDVIYFLMHHRRDSGIYNLGTGKAASFNELAHAIFSSMKLKPNIEYIDTPEDIREKYQYFTQAEMQKLRNIGYKKDFMTLPEGIETYMGFLKNSLYY